MRSVQAFTFVFARRRIAVARHVDQRHARAGKKDQLLRPSRRVRGAGEAVAAGERVDEARLADIGAAGEGDLDGAHGRQCRPRSRRRHELPVGGEQFPPGLDLVGAEVGHAAPVRRYPDAALAWKRQVEPHTARAVSATRRSLAISSSTVMALPPIPLEKPHCGLSASWSIAA